MRIPVHAVQCRVFIKPDDDAELVKRTFMGLFPFNLAEEKIALSEESIQGIERVTIVERVQLNKPKHISMFIEKFLGMLSDDDAELIVEQRESRLDEDGMFYVRLDKKNLLGGTATLTEGGDCFHFIFEMEAFPKKRAGQLYNVTKVFKKGVTMTDA